MYVSPPPFVTLRMFSDENLVRMCPVDIFFFPIMIWGLKSYFLLILVLVLLSARLKAVSGMDTFSCNIQFGRFNFELIIFSHLVCDKSSSMKTPSPSVRSLAFRTHLFFSNMASCFVLLFSSIVLGIKFDIDFRSCFVKYFLNLSSINIFSMDLCPRSRILKLFIIAMFLFSIAEIMPLIIFLSFLILDISKQRLMRFTSLFLK